jgi:hypothetical protein
VSRRALAPSPAALVPGGATGAAERVEPEAERQAERPVPAAPPEEAAADDPALRIAWLEGRVAALEAALERRSGELLLLQRLLCPHDLAQWMRLAAGLPPLPRLPYEPRFWHETSDLTMAEVPETLEALWSSIYSRRPG